MKNPCYKCENRTAGCHAKCDLYQTWAANEFELKKAMYNAKKKVTQTYPAHAERHFKSVTKKT